MTTINGVTFETLADGRTALRGNTFNYKDQIKTAGGTWTPPTKSWTVPAGADLSFIKPPLAAPLASQKPREEWTKEEWERYCLSYSRSHRGNIDRCCKKAKVFFQYDEQGPMCYDCERHGKTHNSYTGD